MTISPKALFATLVPVVAALGLWLVTGDDQWLVGVLAGFVAGGSAFAAPPAKGVSQRQVERLSGR